MTTTRTPPHLTVKLGESDKQLFMSYGLLNRLTLIVGGPEGAPAIGGVPEVQEAVLLEVFTERPKGEAPVPPKSLEEIEISLDDVANVLDWVGGHITDFFLQTVTKSMEKAKAQEGRLQKLGLLVPIVTGSSSSPSTTAAA